MKTIVALAALAFALAAMPSIPQHAYACQTSGCATEEPTQTTVPQGCTSSSCAIPEQPKVLADGGSCNGCATPEEATDPTVTTPPQCNTSSCAIPEQPKVLACQSGNCKDDATPVEDSPAPQQRPEHKNVLACTSSGC